MILFDRERVSNFENALYGMRHPLESYDKSDSFETGDGIYYLGRNDKELALKLIKAGTDHSKFMRQIFVSIDITAPRYWWAEMDTYRVATVCNSTSTMHSIHKKSITPHSFSVEKLHVIDMAIFEKYCEYLESLRQLYLADKNKDTWYTLIQMLPASFNQTRTWTANYQTLRNIYFARRNHKLDEWREFCQWIIELPYSELIVVE